MYEEWKKNQVRISKINKMLKRSLKFKLKMKTMKITCFVFQKTFKISKIWTIYKTCGCKRSSPKVINKMPCFMIVLATNNMCSDNLYYN